MLASVSTGCAGKPPSDPATASESTSAAVPAPSADYRFRAPKASPGAVARSPLLALESPAGHAEVHALVARFFDAIARESKESLAETLTPNAVAHFPGVPATSALGSWIRRFSLLDYHAIEPRETYRPEDVRIYDQHAVRRLRERQDFGLSPGRGELLCLVPLRNPDRALLPAAIQLLLRPAEDGYRIAATHENFAPR